jgi:hypothetical protein
MTCRRLQWQLKDAHDLVPSENWHRGFKPRSEHGCGHALCIILWWGGVMSYHHYETYCCLAKNWESRVEGVRKLLLDFNKKFLKELISYISFTSYWLQYGCILCEFEIVPYKNINKVSLYAPSLKLCESQKKFGRNHLCVSKRVLNYVSFEICKVFRNASSHEMRPHCIRYGTDLIENIAPNSSSVVACAVIAAETCLMRRCIAVVVSFGSTVPVFRRYGEHTDTDNKMIS